MTASIGLAENLDLTATAYYRNTKYTESVPSSVIHRDYDTPGFIVPDQPQGRLGGGSRTI